MKPDSVFEPANKLEQSLKDAFEDYSKLEEFYRTFSESDLFIIQEGIPEAESGAAYLERGDILHIRDIENDGKAYVPVFSSVERLKAVAPAGAGHMSIPSKALMGITKGRQLLLNPGAELGKPFTEKEIEALLDGEIWNAFARRRASQA